MPATRARPRALPPVCILAGGRGRRLGELAREVPKPLLEVAGEPFLLHQLRLLAAGGAREAVICVGHRGELIESRIGRERFGVRIAYSHDGPGLDGTLGAIRRARPLLGERFLVLYGDTYLRLDYRAAARAWGESGLPALMVVLRNDGRWDASNAHYERGRVLAYDKRTPAPRMRWIDYGLGGLTPATLDRAGVSERDLAGLYRALARGGELCGFPASQRFYEIGTPAALCETDAFLRGLRCASGPTSALEHEAAPLPPSRRRPHRIS
ncbi:MAG TPA: sugar phosphate nucleotidyltransferase [Solirubrobacteraceae bacterium]|nr:sugar phosphate nucleotidyltransferase [Solirubrobacteraceae bacterium]